MNQFNSSDQPLICLITEGEMTAENFTEKKSQILELIQTAVREKISITQIREKQIPSRMVFEIVSEAAKLTRKTATKLLVNDRADIALAANADGVHLTSHSISAEIIKQNFPKNFIVGVSAHSIEAAQAARNQAADFVAFSPIFSSPDKGNPQGIKKLREICQSLNPFPVIALGGIDATNFAQVLNAGASGFAAVRFLNNEENLRKLAAGLSEYKNQNE